MLGESVTVRGTVANVHTSRAGNTFLNFGRPYPNQVFTAVVFRNRATLFKNLSALEGRDGPNSPIQGEARDHS